MLKNLDEETLLDQVGQILGPEGLLAKTGKDGLSYSQKQYDYARHVASGFCRYDEVLGKASLNILEAATGTGKTIGYLVPLMLVAAHTGERVAVSTFTRQLQKQIVEEDANLVANWVRTVTGKSLRVARRVGVNNYVSPAACARLIDALEADNKKGRFDESIDFLHDLIKWVTDQGPYKHANTSGLLDDYISQGDLTAMPDGISLRSIHLEPSSPATELEKYKRDIAKSKEVDVLVINHALAVVNSLRWASVLDDTDKRPISVLVCDEADRLPSVAESLIGSDLLLHKLTKIVSSFADSLGMPKFSKSFHDLHDYIMSLRPPAGDMLALSDSSVLSGLVKDAQRSLIPLEQAIVDRMSGDGSLFDEDRNVRTLEFIDAANDLTTFCKALASDENSAIVSWSPVRAFPSLRVSRPNPGRLMGRMWSPREWEIHQDKDGDDALLLPRSYLRSALFTSATLATPGRGIVEQFDDFANSIGIVRRQNIHNTRTELYASFEPIKFGRMSFVLSDPRMAPPSLRIKDEFNEHEYMTNPEWLDYCAAMIRHAHSKGKRCLVLALSFNDTAELAKRLADLPDVIAHKPKEPLQQVLSKYVENTRAVLISPAAWEGVNLPGMVNELVVTRIPFPPMNASQTGQLEMHLISKGYGVDKIKSILHNDRTSFTRKKLKQGLGRGVRQVTDHVRVWIADPRFPLPDWMAGSLDEVLTSGNTHRVHRSMAACIPRRFIDGSAEGGGFANAQLFLVDRTVYQPTPI